MLAQITGDNFDVHIAKNEKGEIQTYENYPIPEVQVVGQKIGFWSQFFAWFLFFNFNLNIQGNAFEQIPTKHRVSTGGIENTARNTGENLETRVADGDDIERNRIDWLFNLTDVYSPEIFPDLKLPNYVESIHHLTDAANAANAAIEINKVRHSSINNNKFNINIIRTDPNGNALSVEDPTNDTNGLAKAFKHVNDSINQANGWK